MAFNLPDISPSYLLWPDQQQQQMTPEALAMRQKLLLAQAGQRRPFPKTLGEGLSALGDALGQRIAMNRLSSQENASAQYDLARRRGVLPGAAVPAATPAQRQPPPAAVAPPAVVQPPQQQSSANTDPDTTQTADTDPDPGVARDNIATALLAPTAQGVPQQNPTEPGPEAPDTTISSVDGGPTASPDGVAAAAPDDANVARQNAIASIETGGRRDPYQTVGVTTRYRDGTVDQPYGRYQVMGKNIPRWTQAALGQSMSPQEFLASPEAQDAVFNHRFGSYVDKYGEEGAARAWFGGPRGMNHPDHTDVLGTRLGDYGKMYMARLNGDDGAPAPRSDGTVQVASLDPAAGVSAVAPDEASDNPPITTNDIQPAPTQVAQNGQLQYGGKGIPDVLAPTPTQPTPQVGGRVKLSPYQEPGAQPVPPPPSPMSALEQRAWQLMADPYVSQATRDQAKSVIQYEQAQRKAIDDRLMSTYKVDSAVWEDAKKKNVDARLNQPKTELEQRTGEQTLADKQQADLIRQKLGGLDQSVVEAPYKATLEAVSSLPNSMAALKNARDAIVNGKAFTGTGAPFELEMAKLWKAMGAPGNPAISATENFQNFMMNELGQIRKGMFGNSRVTNQDVKIAQSASGGDVKLDRDTILRVIDELENANRKTAIAHQRNVLNYSLGDPVRAQRLSATGIQPEVMEQLVPETMALPNGQKARTADVLMQGGPDAAKQFDQTFATPGLAQRILARERARQQQR
jgi:hypothetical protein